MVGFRHPRDAAAGHLAKFPVLEHGFLRAAPGAVHLRGQVKLLQLLNGCLLCYLHILLLLAIQSQSNPQDSVVRVLQSWAASAVLATPLGDLPSSFV